MARLNTVAPLAEPLKERTVSPSQFLDGLGQQAARRTGANRFIRRKNRQKNNKLKLTTLQPIYPK